MGTKTKITDKYNLKKKNRIYEAKRFKHGGFQRTIIYNICATLRKENHHD